MRMPSYTAICSFIFSTMLTSAFIPSNGDLSLAAAGAPAVQMAVQTALNGLKTQGFAGSSGFALPTPASTPTALPSSAVTISGSGLTTETMSKILQLISSKGDDGNVGAAVANALGLSPAGQPWTDHKIAVASADKVIHGFAVSRGSDADVVIYTRQTDGVHIFRAHRDGKLVAAVTIDSQAQKIVVRATAEAQTEHDRELAFWNDNVDKLLAGA